MQYVSGKNFTYVLWSLIAVVIILVASAFFDLNRSVEKILGDELNPEQEAMLARKKLVASMILSFVIYVVCIIAGQSPFQAGTNAFVVSQSVYY